MGKFVPYSSIKKELAFAKKHSLRILLGGGELALHPEFEMILQDVKPLDARLVTNGRIFHQEKITKKTNCRCD